MEQAFLDLMAHTVTIEPFLSQNAYGDPSFAAAASYQCRIEHKIRQIMTYAGEEVISNTALYIDTTIFIDERSRITLPSGMSPRKPPIMRIDRVSDEIGLHHSVIFC